MIKFIAYTYVLLVCSFAFWMTSCSSSGGSTTENAEVSNTESTVNLEEVSFTASYDEEILFTDTEPDWNIYLSNEEFEYQYQKKVDPPPFDYNQSIEGLTFPQLRMKRYEIFARRGFLFMDADARAYFNGFKWYQPIYWDPNFKVYLNEDDKTFVKKVMRAEIQAYASRYLDQDKKQLDWKAIVNKEQFKNFSPSFIEQLQKNGFAIAPAAHEQLFFLYDQNQYNYVPTYITPDLLLQVMHMHLSKQIQIVEESMFMGDFAEITQALYKYHQEKYASESNPKIKEAHARGFIFYGIAYSVLTDKNLRIPSGFSGTYAEECAKIRSAEGKGSQFLGDLNFDYTQFKARGNYTRTEELKKYFRAIKWLNSAPCILNSSENPAFLESILSVQYLRTQTGLMDKFKRYYSFVNYLAGEEDNLSYDILRKTLEELKISPSTTAMDPGQINKIFQALLKKNPEKIRTKGINEEVQEYVSVPRLFFTAGRYSLDAEIFIKLVHVDQNDPKRPFPKGLDLFAAMGNTYAEKILLEHHKEASSWAAYPDSLNFMKNKFKDFNAWDQSVYNGQVHALLNLQQDVQANSPYFMGTEAYAYKNLNTALASWAELKHDLLLYAKQPIAAQAGQGGGPEPPNPVGTVEANPVFWKSCIDLLERNATLLNQTNSSVLQERNKRIIDILKFLHETSEKVLRNERLSISEHQRLNWMGGEIEGLTLQILDSPDGFYSIETPDKYMMVAADVYTYKDQCLETAVGAGDELYVLVEINGLPKIARGSIFSYYEFPRSSGDRLTDEQWQEIVLSKRQPNRCSWYAPLVSTQTEVKTSVSYCF